MRVGSLLAGTLLITVLAGQAQASDTLQAAYDANQVFMLRNAVRRAPAPLFYRAVVEASSNRVQAAEKDLRTVIEYAPHSKDAYEAHDLLGNMYFRNGMYRKGLDETIAVLHEHPDAPDANSVVPILTALNALPTMTIVSFKPSSIQTQPGSIFLPLTLNGKKAEFFFDTGAGISLIGESEAKHLGLMGSPVEGRIGDSSGQGVAELRISLVSDLLIGGLHLRNVPFLVIPDTGEPWNQLPQNKHGILGLPLLLAMQTIRWTPQGKFEFGFPPQDLNIDTCNMLFVNSNLVIDALVGSKHLDFALDTGAINTALNPSFGKMFPTLMRTGIPENRSIEGLGGTTSESSLLLPSVTFQIGGQSLSLSPAHVFTQHGIGTWSGGNIGMDLLRQAHAFTLDFHAMTLHLH